LLIVAIKRKKPFVKGFFNIALNNFFKR
jgi:hypothetical protein